jgi:hypothetical protein
VAAAVATSRAVYRLGCDGDQSQVDAIDPAQIDPPEQVTPVQPIDPAMLASL